MLRKNYGCVRVDFNQPFSLKVTERRFTFTSLLVTYTFMEKVQTMTNKGMWHVQTGTHWFVCLSLQEYLDSQRNRHIPPSVSLEQTLMPIIISAQ